MTTSRTIPTGSRIAIVGAGIIGVSTAFSLQRRGYQVTLFDRAEPGRTGPSFGNAGHVVGSAIEPLASPGIALDGLRMLLDPAGALKIPPAYAGNILPWLSRFWRSSQGAAHARIVKVLTAFNASVLDDMTAEFADAGIASMLRRTPAIYLYESRASFQQSQHSWALRRAAGLDSTELDATQIREMEPHLAPIFPHGVLNAEWAVVTDPYAVVKGLFAAGLQHGISFVQSRVQAVQPTPDGIAIVADGARQPFDAAVVAAGVWSRPLARLLGDNLPVEAERGYNLTFPGQQHRVRNPLVLADRGVVATSLAPGLRIGGWTELGGTELPPNSRNWQIMRQVCDAVSPRARRGRGERMDGSPAVHAGLNSRDLALTPLRPGVLHRRARTLRPQPVCDDRARAD